MSHVDGKTAGLDLMAKQLLEETKGDLSGFELYVTTNYTWELRVIGLIAIIWFMLSRADISEFWGTAIVLGLFYYFFFGSATFIYIFARKWFNTWRVILRMPRQLWGCVEVEVDAASTTGPTHPRRDTLSTEERERRYGATSSWFKKMKPSERKE